MIMNRKTIIALMLMLGASSAQAQKLVVKEGEIDCGKVEY